MDEASRDMNTEHRGRPWMAHIPDHMAVLLCGRLQRISEPRDSYHIALDPRGRHEQHMGCQMAQGHEEECLKETSNRSEEVHHFDFGLPRSVSRFLGKMLISRPALLSFLLSKVAFLSEYLPLRRYSVSSSLNDSPSSNSPANSLL